MADRRQILVLQLILHIAAREESAIATRTGMAEAVHRILPDLANDIGRIARQIDREIVDALGAGFGSQAEITARPGGSLSATIMLTRAGRRPPTGAYRREIEEIVRTTSEAVVRQACRILHPATDWLISASTWSSSLVEPPRAKRQSSRALPRWASAMFVVALAAAALFVGAERVASGLTPANRQRVALAE